MTGGSPYVALLDGYLEGEALDRMVRYAELLERWSARHNLIRFDDPVELVQRHLVDALTGVRLLEGRGTLADIGSGAGLPGVPLLVARPCWRGLLIEPRQKRWAFLRLVIRELGLAAEAVDRRYEDLGDDRRFDLITLRAVAGHARVLDWARPRLAAGGGVALWTTEEGERSLAEKRGWRVLSWPAVGLDRGRLVYLQPAPTDAVG